MKTIYLLGCLGIGLMSHIVQAQTTLSNNGLNLGVLCSGENCKYISNTVPIHHPNLNYGEWLMENNEIAIKQNGKFLATGDLHVNGLDTAAIIQLEFLFVDESNQTIFKYETDKFEFFNEPNHSEPIFFISDLPQNLVSSVSAVDVEVKYSERIPIFQVGSNCFLPCKEVGLKDAIKLFKKSK